MKRWTGRQMGGCEMEEYKAGRSVELEVFQRERHGREAVKLSKGGQRGEDSGETKKGIIWYRSEGERGRGEEDCTMWGLGRRAGSRGDNSLNWKKNRILSGCRVRGKNAACHSPVLFSYSSLPLLVFSPLSSYFFVFSLSGCVFSLSVVLSACVEFPCFRLKVIREGFFLLFCVRV